MKKPTITQQIQRLKSILNNPVVESCLCGMKYIPMGGGNCEKCGSMLIYDFDDEFEMEYEQVSFEEGEV